MSLNLIPRPHDGPSDSGTCGYTPRSDLRLGHDSTVETTPGRRPPPPPSPAELHTSLSNEGRPGWDKGDIGVTEVVRDRGPWDVDGESRPSGREVATMR